jgi:hypothetical protein
MYKAVGKQFFIPLHTAKSLEKAPNKGKLKIEKTL